MAHRESRSASVYSGAEPGVRIALERSIPYRRFAMAALTDADGVVMRLVWMAGLIFWREASYLAEFGGERDGAS